MRDSRNVALKREYLQIEHEPDMIFELLRYAEWPSHRQRGIGRFGVLRLDALEAQLNLANRAEILIDSFACRPAPRVPFSCYMDPGDGVQNAAIFLQTDGALFRAFASSPKRRSKTKRGSFSMGSGVVAELQDNVLLYAQV